MTHEVSVKYWDHEIPEYLKELLRGTGGVSWAKISVDIKPEELVEVYAPVAVSLNPAEFGPEDFEITTEGHNPSIIDALIAEQNGVETTVRMAPTNAVITAITARLPVEAARYWKKLVDFQKWKEEQNRHPDLTGWISTTPSNWRQLQAAVIRACRREKRPVHPRHYLLESTAGTIYMRCPFARVERQVRDFCAHAASSGWLELEWDPHDKVIIGDRMRFLNGEVIPEDQTTDELETVKIRM